MSNTSTASADAALAAATSDAPAWDDVRAFVADIEDISREIVRQSREDKARTARASTNGSADRHSYVDAQHQTPASLAVLLECVTAALEPVHAALRKHSERIGLIESGEAGHRSYERSSDLHRELVALLARVATLEQRPSLIDRGVWKDGDSYERGDAVTWGGSLFVAQCTTSAKPETSPEWRLAVKRGRDGRDLR